MFTYEITVVCDTCKATHASPTLLHPDLPTVVRSASAGGWHFSSTLRATRPECITPARKVRWPKPQKKGKQ